MAHGKQKPAQEEESAEGAPLWIISFADMMSLLMAFFVMLSTFSGFGPSEAERLRKAVKATLQAHYGGWQPQRSRTAMGYQSPAAGQLEKGSEKPTLQGEQGKGLLKETSAGDFRKNKIFVIESNQVFWGTGTTLSARGRDFLDTLASYLGQLPDRLVISEGGPGQGAGGREQGAETLSADTRPLPPAPSSDAGPVRAMAVLNYLTRQGIAKDRCSIATHGMSPERRVERVPQREDSRWGGDPNAPFRVGDPGAQSQRLLEIALLSRSVYQ